MELTGNTFFFPWEVSLMERLQANLGGTGLNILSFLSAFGEELVLILLIGFLYWWWDKQIGKNIGLNALMGLVWNPMIKNIFDRRRPYLDHEGIRLLRKVDSARDEQNIAAQGFSFPSGHSTNSVTVYGSLGLEFRKKWAAVLAFLMPLLIGFSRVAAGAHYPTDVLVGWLLGVLTILIVPFLRRKIPNTPVFYGVLLLTVIPGFFYCHSDDYFTAVGMLIGFMAGTLLDERKIRFENTRSIPIGLLRMVGGFALYFLLNTLLKLPFPKEFLDSGTTAARLIRAARYAILVFGLFGVYPMLFPAFDRLLKKKETPAA